MTDFYKMDPAAWDFGTANLSLEEEAAYLRLVNAMHKHKGPVPDNDRVLAGLFRSSTRKARALVTALAAAGKIEIADGMISNHRAISDLVHRGFVSISRAESGAKGGRTRAENAAKALEANDQEQAIASSREEKRREEIKREPIGSPKKTPAPPKLRRRPEVPLPPDWVPSDRNIADAQDRQFSAREIQDEADRFRDHHLARETRFRDWDAAWRTWLGNARRFEDRRMAGAAGAGRYGQGSSIASIAARRRAEGQV